MVSKHSISSQNRNNWFIDIILFSSGLLASVSEIYFLFLPLNGYQGGRNVFYGVTILFTRHSWELIHTWAGIIMIAMATFHLLIHWKWVSNMFKRLTKELTGKVGPMNSRGRFNLVLNIVLASSFFLTGISGLYFFFFPGASHNSGSELEGWLFPNAGWDLIHTWAGIIMIAAAILHFAIHWRWVVKVTQNLARSGYWSLSNGLYNSRF